MARNIIKSYNSIVATQDATVAFSTANQSLKLHKITQGLDYSRCKFKHYIHART